MKQGTLKKQSAEAALKFVQPNSIIGVGTGSTVRYFIDALATRKHEIEGAVSSSEASTELLKKHQIPVFDLNEVHHLSLYVDGADEVTPQLHMIKGGGAALTREKIIAAQAETFICIADQNKVVDQLGHFPLPIDVIPMARSYVAREILKLGADPVYRQGVITDNGHVILDIHHLDIKDPIALEQRINQIPGVVTCGLFAQRPADLLLLGTEEGVQEISLNQPILK